MRLRVLAVVSAALVPPAAASAQIPLTPEFQLNTFTTAAQIGQAIASDAAGNFVVAWTSYGQDGSDTGVFARRVTAAGVPGPAEFRVNTYTTGFQRSASVASDANGRLVVVWTSSDQDGDASGVFGRRYDSSGIPGPEFRVNSQTANGQGPAKVAMDASGAFVVAWTSNGQDGDTTGVFARRYNAAGVAQGGTEFRVNAYTTSFQGSAAVAMDATGDFVVAWMSYGQDGSGDGIYAQRYDASGTPLGGEFRVNSYTTGEQYRPLAAMDANGNFVVVWQSTGQAGQGEELFGQLYDAAGVALTGEFHINQYTTADQFGSSLAMDARGNFVVAWTSPFQDGSDYGAFARAFDATGTPQSDEFQLSQFTVGHQAYPAVAAQPGGRFVVSWLSYFQDGDHFGMFGRRFATDLIARDGFESADLSGWSTSQTDGGDLTASASAALNFTNAGLLGLVDDTAGLFVQDDSPDDEDRYRARFFFDPNGFDPGEAQNHRRTRLFIAFEEAPVRRLAAVVLRRLNGSYGLLGRARLDDNSQYDTGFFGISDAPHMVELAWKRATGPGANDGEFQMWIDGLSVHAASTLDNSLSGVDFVRMGALSVKTGATGTMYWDEFESRRLNYVGAPDNVIERQSFIGP